MTKAALVLTKDDSEVYLDGQVPAVVFQASNCTVYCEVDAVIDPPPGTQLYGVRGEYDKFRWMSGRKVPVEGNRIVGPRVKNCVKAAFQLRGLTVVDPDISYVDDGFVIGNPYKKGGRWTIESRVEGGRSHHLGANEGQFPDLTQHSDGCQLDGGGGWAILGHHFDLHATRLPTSTGGLWTPSSCLMADGTFAPVSAPCAIMGCTFDGAAISLRIYDNANGIEDGAIQVGGSLPAQRNVFLRHVVRPWIINMGGSAPINMHGIKNAGTFYSDNDFSNARKVA